jgi:hypothetical protein
LDGLPRERFTVPLLIEQFDAEPGELAGAQMVSARAAHDFP